MGKTIKLWIDMDGTLCEWNPKATCRDLYQEGYFFHCIPHQNVIEALIKMKIERPGIEINIISAYLEDSKYALTEKRKWLESTKLEPLITRKVFLPCGLSKVSFLEKVRGSAITKDDILIDDYNVNLAEWKSAGGTAVKMLNGINGKLNDYRECDIPFLKLNEAHTIGYEEEIDMQKLNRFETPVQIKRCLQEIMVQVKQQERKLKVVK